jgi:hypothetical protein
MKSTIIFLLTAILVMGMQSCATVFSGCTSKIKIDGYPTQSYVYYNGVIKGVTPMKLKVNKQDLKNSPEVIIKKEGFEEQTIILKRQLKASALVGNIVFTGALGLAVDFIDGAIYKPDTDKIDFTLERKK